MDAKVLEHMMLFAEVADCGSFTAAAERLGVSKGHVSQKISRLEKDLDSQLLFRTTRRIQLTAAGEALLRQVPKLRDFWYETQSRVQSTRDEVGGLLRITAPTYMAEHLLWPKLEQFMVRYPDISIELNAENQLIDPVQAGYDLAIRITETPPDHLIARELIRVQYCCCATPEYLKQQGMPAIPEDLKKHACLALSTWHTWRFYAAQKCSHVSVKGRLRTNNNNILKKSALAHQGIIRLPHYMIESELANGELVQVLPQYQHEQLPVYLIYPPLKKRPQKTQNCIRFLLSVFNNE